MSQPGPQESSPSRSPRHAGFWVRVAANLLDAIILGIPVLLLVSAIFGLGPDIGEIAGFDFEYTDAAGEDSTAHVSFSIADLFNLLLFAVLTILLWVNWDGRTPGKKILSIRIVTCPGYQQLSYVAAIVRMIASLLSLIVVGLGYVIIGIMVALRADKRGYHDLVARTCVIHDE